MDRIVRAAAVYVFLWLVFRLLGRRALSQVSTFDFILFLIISETLQQAMVGDDHSLTGSVLMIVTFVVIDVALSFVKRAHPLADKLLDGLPCVLVEDGVVLPERLRKTRMTKGDILVAARQSQGLVRIEQIKYAILEQSGSISIIPFEP